MKSLLLILILSLPALAQSCLKEHVTVKEFYDSLRILPAKVTSADIENQLVYFKFEEKTQIHLGSFKMIEGGNYEPNFWANYNDTFIFLYCANHYTLFQAVKFNPKGKK